MTAFPCQVWNGEVITEPGIYSNMPLDHYHRADVCAGISISSSGLRKIMLESPAHFWCRAPQNPNRIRGEELPRAFAVGRAMHHLALGEQYFSAIFRRAPTEVYTANGEPRPWSLTTKMAKEWKAATEQQGFIVIFPAEAEQLRGM